MNLMLINILQATIAIGLLNVWIVRFKKQTDYRGGNASNITEEFAAYGLPLWFCYFIGFLKISSAAALLIGIFYPPLTFPASLLISFLMIGAILMHMKIGDPIKKAFPATLMFCMSLLVCAGSYGLS